jgi:hypothetical protein
MNSKKIITFPQNTSTNIREVLIVFLPEPRLLVNLLEGTSIPLQPEESFASLVYHNAIADNARMHVTVKLLRIS